MDLSPGMRMRPFSGPDLTAVSGIAGRWLIVTYQAGVGQQPGQGHWRYTRTRLSQAIADVTISSTWSKEEIDKRVWRWLEPLRFQIGAFKLAKPELGTKRVCLSCSVKYYDLNRDPIVCPSCGAVFEIAREKAAPEKAAEKEKPESEEAGAEAPAETQGAEVISLEDAEDDDDDAVDGDPNVDADDDEVPDLPDLPDDDDIEIDDDEDSDKFLEDDDEQNDDMSDIIGDVDSKEEET